MARPKPIETLEQYKARQAMYVQRWRVANPEKQALARKRAYNNRKLKAMRMIAEPVCNRCGCDELDFLEFNHIAGGGSVEFRADTYMSMADKLITGKRGTDGLEILCRVCNALDYLERKNPEAAKHYNVEYCDVIRKRYVNHIGEGENWQDVTPVVNAKELEHASR